MPTAFTRSEQLTFWSHNKAPFKADSVASGLVGLIRPYVGQRIIDVGAANGALIRELRRRLPGQAEIIGIDLVPVGKDVLVGDLTALPYPDQSFDTVFCTDVIEHLDDQMLGECFAQLRRVLTVGGHAVFTTLNREDLSLSTVTCPKCRFEFHRWGHCRVFSPDTIRRLLESTGFEVVAVRELNLTFFSRHRVVQSFLPWIKFERVFEKFPYLHVPRDDLVAVVTKTTP